MAAFVSDGNSTINAGLLAAILKDSKQLPEMFIESDQNHRPSLESASLEDPDLDIPVLDLSFLAAGNSTQRAEVVAAAAKACQTACFSSPSMSRSAVTARLALLSDTAPTHGSTRK